MAAWKARVYFHGIPESDSGQPLCPIPMKKILFTALCIVPLLAFAQENTPADGAKPKKPKADAATRFNAMDKNKDGKVTKEEFMANKKGEWAAQGEKAFAGKDKDGDGSLTLEEFSAKKN